MKIVFLFASQGVVQMCLAYLKLGKWVDVALCGSVSRLAPTYSGASCLPASEVSTSATVLLHYSARWPIVRFEAYLTWE